MSEKRILTIEDDEGMLQTVTEKLSAAGFKTISAKDGAEGLATALAEKPDLIILDLGLPVMDGMEVFEKLRANDWGKTVPVIILTVREANEDVMKGIMKCEPAYYFIKGDWNLNDVVEKVQETLAG